MLSNLVQSSGGTLQLSRLFTLLLELIVQVICVRAEGIHCCVVLFLSLLSCNRLQLYLYYSAEVVHADGTVQGSLKTCPRNG